MKNRTGFMGSNVLELQGQNAGLVLSAAPEKKDEAPKKDSNSSCSDIELGSDALEMLGDLDLDEDIEDTMSKADQKRGVTVDFAVQRLHYI